MLLVKLLQSKDLILTAYEEVENPVWVDASYAKYALAKVSEINKYLGTDLSPDELVGKVYETQSAYGYGDTY